MVNRIFRVGRRIENLIYYLLSTKKRHSLTIMDILSTVDDIYMGRKSVSRYGDGEFDILLSYLTDRNIGIGFQTYSAKLGMRLMEILQADPLDNHLICLPGCIGSLGVCDLRWEDSRYWQNYLRLHLSQLLKIIHTQHRYYGNAFFTRFYLPFRIKKNVHYYINELKKIWTNRDVLIIEGVMTRLGVNNDLLGGAKSIRRILAPDKDAFNKYDKIYDTAVSYLQEQDADILILVSLGPTATILTYDLAKAGYQAIDTGHMDLEYEWMRRRVNSKVKVDGKFVNEVTGDDKEAEFDDAEYLSSIIVNIE